MKIIGAVLAGFHAIVATALSSSAKGDAGSPAPVGDPTPINIECATGEAPAKTSVSQPNTTVTVTCNKGSSIQLPEAKDLFFDASCTKNVVLSSVCPGAAVTPVKNHEVSQGPKKVDVLFPQLPPSAQVVCLKCKVDSKDCKAVVDVAAARPQGKQRNCLADGRNIQYVPAYVANCRPFCGEPACTCVPAYVRICEYVSCVRWHVGPQAWAGAGSSFTFQVKKAGVSVQFACGTGLTLMPAGATKAYAGDCTKEETVKGMKRIPGPGAYVTLKVDESQRKTLCYLCTQSADAAKTGGEAAL